MRQQTLKQIAAKGLGLSFAVPPSLERRLRAMGKRWNYSPEEVQTVLDWAKDDPTTWLQTVAADERIHGIVVEVNQ